MLTPDEADELAFLVAKLEADNARNSLLAFAKYVRKDFKAPSHIQRLAAALEDLEAGRIKRLAVSMPPGHGKSWLASQLFPAWCIGRDPSCRLAIASYNEDLALESTIPARRIFNSEEFAAAFPHVRQDDGGRHTQERMDFIGGGYYLGVGTNGGITGKRFRIGIGDDLIKGITQALSKTEREKVWRWYLNDFLTREEHGGEARVALIGTRWNRDDPIGRAIRAEPDKWTVIRMPAITKDDAGDERALCEEFVPLVKLRQMRALLGKSFRHVYQQEEVADGGNVFKVNTIREENPDKWEGLRFTRAWDMASSVKQRSGDDPDWTVGVLAAIRKEKDASTGAMIPHLYVRDVVFLREESPRRNARIKQAAEEDGQGVQIVVEAFGAYKDAANELTQALAGQRSIRQIRPPGDKMAKAAPLEPIFEAGNVHVPVGAPWLAQWLQHFEEFPQGAHDDACDATALIWHAQAGGSGVWL